MAEGGIGWSPVKLKPVPPPKPTCTSPGNTKPSFTNNKSPEGNSRISVKDLATSYPEQSHELKSPTNILTPSGINNGSRTSVNTPQATKPASKPPLLPKPNLSKFPSLRRVESPSSHPLSWKQSRHSSPHAAEGSTSDSTRKPPSKLFISQSKFSDVEHRKSNNASDVKAPVAKLEEFDSLCDQVGPVRPPRSPKHKSLVCELSDRQHPLINKSASLNRKSAGTVERMVKSRSLGRGRENDMVQLWQQEEDQCPVRPPRRRNKSVTPECEQGFCFDKVQPDIPVYAQVNYNLKRSRRVECQERNPPDSVLKLDESEGDPKDPSFSSVWEGETHNEKDISNVIHSVNGEDGIRIDCVPSSYEVGVQESYNKIGTVVTGEECSEACADCLSAKILEESCDDSITSSKLEWRSVRSSLSSGSEVAVEPGEQLINPELCSSSRTQAQEEGSERDSASGGSTLQFENCCGKCESCHKCKLHLSGSLLISDKLPSSPALGKRSTRHYKRLTSSLPSHGKSLKQQTRRQSWNSPKDTVYYADWNLSKQSSWLDEGESSSGNFGDLDSSDNAAHRNSLEEINRKSKNDQSMGRRLTLWWSSFGKSGKKHGNTKRHSYFYCERQDSSECEEQSSRNSMNVEIKHSSTVLNISQTPPQVSSSCVELPTSGTSELDFHDMSYKVTSEESIISDMHSDSEGEGGDGCDPNVKSRTQRDVKKAFYIANELMTSEQVFINALKLLNVDFREAVAKASSYGHRVIPVSDFEKIINSLPQLQRLNEDLLRDLEERIQNWSSVQKIADVIVKKGPFLKLYTSYIKNFEAQCNYFDECCQKYPKFAKAVREFEASAICQKLSIKHFMLKPVQRIPQYRLLLDDYLRHLNPSSPDYEDTQIALKIVSDVAEHANRSIKQGDHLSVLLQLQAQLGNFEIIKPGRILLKEGELYKLSRKERQPRYFILLNDCLLYTSYYGSGPSSGLKVNTELPLGGMKVTIPQAEDYHNEFNIITSTRSFTLSARSSAERQEWAEALHKAIREYTSRQLSFQLQKLNVARVDGCSELFKLGKEAPIWIQDGRVTKCQSCVAEFTVTFRRHHCRACGKVVCGVCSAFRAPMQYMKFQANRVCEDCFHTLLQEFDTPGNKIIEVIKTELGLRKLDQNVIGSIRSQFKRLGPSSGKKSKKHIPQRLLEVTANDTGSQMCGWLQRRSKRQWKKLWFVLKEQVLYVYKACEDVVALESIPVLGYKVEPMKQNHFQLYEGVDAKLVFQLAHPNQQPLVFSADSENLVNRWISELQEATVLK